MKSATAVHQHGQSTTEFTLLALVLTPLFIALPLIGKYLDLAQTSEIAARYLIFEATIGQPDAAGSDAALAAQVRSRFLGTGANAVRSFTPRQDGANQAIPPHNPLWTDHHAAALLSAAPADIEVQTSTRPLPHTAASAVAESLALDEGHAHRALLKLRLQAPSMLQPFAARGLEIRRHQVIHRGDWVAAGPDEVSSRIERGSTWVYPVTALQTLGSTVGRLPALVLDPTPDIGRIQPDIVPCDRLEGGC